MNILSIYRRHMSPAVLGAGLVLLFISSAGQVGAATVTAPFVQQGNTVTTPGASGTFNNSTFQDGGNTYTVNVSPASGQTATLNNTDSVVLVGNNSSVTINSGITLNNSGTTNGTVQIDGSGTVTNFGTINSSAGNGESITINGTGTVVNSGNMTSLLGVFVTGSGSLSNSGGITATSGAGVHFGGFVTVNNSGAIAGGAGNVALLLDNGGNVTNSGTLTGGSDISSGGSGSLNNSGTITANNGNAINFTNNGSNATITNSSTGTITATNGSGVNLSGTGTVSNSGTLNGTAWSINMGSDGTVNNSGTMTSGEGVVIAGTGTVNNSGSIIATSTGGDGLSIAGNGTVNNSGTINGGTATQGIYISGVGNLTNSGSSTSGLGVEIFGDGSTVNNTSSGVIIATAANGDGIAMVGTGVAVTNAGIVTAGHNGTGIDLASSNSSLLTFGGQITSNADAINLGGSSSSVTVQGRTNVQGLIDGNNNAGNVLTLNLVGMTPAQAATANAARGQSTDTIMAGTGANQYTYAWANFQTVNITAISLETAVDRGLTGIATKIDNNQLPLAFDPFYTAAFANPEAALNNFTGREFLNAFVLQGLSDATAFSDLADGRAFDLRAGASGLDFAGLNVTSGSMLASLGGTESVLNRLGSSLSGGVTMSDSKEVLNVASPESSPWAAWVSGTVTIADDPSSSTNPGFTATSGSPTIGVDYRICPDFVLGTLFNYTTSGANFSDGSRLNADSELFGLYADWAHDSWFINGLVGGGISSYRQQRTTLGGGTALASPDGNEVLANIDSGYDFKVAGWVISPEAGLNYTHLSKDSFSESGGGAFDLNVGTQDVDSLRTKLGFRAARPFTWDSIKFVPQINANWYHECLDETNDVSTSVPGAPVLGSFQVTTNPEGRDFALAGAGLSATPAEWHDNVTFFVNYDAQIGQTNFIAHTINGGLRVNF